MASQVLDSRVRCKNPAVFVGRKSFRVVYIHLEEIFVKTVITTIPASLIIEKIAISYIDVGADKTWERFRAQRMRIEQVGFSFLRQFGIERVAGEIRKTRPFENE